MDIAKYQELTGLTVDSTETATVTAQIRRTRLILESMLGYTLDPKKALENQYEEKGKATTDCIFRGVISNINDLELDPADDIQGSYRLFSYHHADKYFSVDPFVKLYKVKLVFLQSGGADENGITHKTFDDARVRIHKVGGVSKYIEKCNECLCTCDCDDCVQLAVDADWLNADCVPEDLLYVWADMVTYYTDSKKDLKSETLGTHSYTKATLSKPEELSESLKIISKYAGPNGSVVRIPTV